MPAKTKEEIINNARRLESSGAAPEKIRQYVNLASQELKAQAQPSLAETVSPLLMKAVSPFLDVTTPLNNPISNRLEQAGEKVNSGVQGTADTLAEKGLPMTATLMSLGGDTLKMTPTNAAIGMGAELLPQGLSPLANRAERIRRSIGNKFIDTPIASLKKSFRQGAETLGEKFLNTNLPANREEAFAQSANIVDNYENKIADVLNRTVKKGRTPKGVITPMMERDAFSQLGRQADSGFSLPEGSPPIRYGEPKVGTIPRDVVTEENLMTPGKSFTKGNSRGVLNIENPDIEAKQIEYLKGQKADDVLAARKAFAERLQDPEYGFGIKHDFAISRDQVAKSLDKEIADAAQTGLEKNTEEALKQMKQDFIESHPKYADVQYWNDVKRAIYNKVGDKGYLSKAPTDTISAMKSVASAIRQSVEDVAPEIKALNEKQGTYLQIRNSLGEALAKRSKSGVGSAIKTDLKDEALVNSARNKWFQNTYQTRGVGGIGASTYRTPFNDQE